MNRGHRPKQGSRGNEAPAVEEQKEAKVVAAIPCFNEERFIGSVVLKTKGYVDEVMVIDDGSTDRTALVAEKAGAIVIRHESNQGKGAAVSTAFEWARETGCRALVLLDGDGQHEPADIPSLLQPVLEGRADMVVGSRLLHIKSHIPRVRALGQRILTFFTNLGSRVKLTDSQSGFRAFSPKAIEALSFAEKGLSVESEMQFLAKDANLQVVEVPVSVLYYGIAKRSYLAHGMWVFNSIMGLISRRLPLFFFGVPGVVMLALGIWQGARVIQGYNSTGDFYIGPALLAVLLCTVGTLSVFTGLILYTIRSFFK
jgi:glycosyltransferase involved in cell wall biosynthesis